MKKKIYISLPISGRDMEDVESKMGRGEEALRIMVDKKLKGE